MDLIEANKFGFFVMVYMEALIFIHEGICLAYEAIRVFIYMIRSTFSAILYGFMQEIKVLPFYITFFDETC